MRLDYIIQTIVAAVLVALMVWMLQGCKAQDCIPETIVKDSIRTEYKLDSIYLYEKDSIYIHQKADTVYVNKYITRYKDVMKIERDTVTLTNNIVKVQEIRYIPKFYKVMTWIGVGMIVLLIGWFALKIYKAFFLKV